MRRFFQAIFWLIFLAGIAAAYFVAPAAGLMVFVAAVPFVFSWPSPSDEGLRAFAMLLTAMCFVGTQMTDAWYPWAGVVLFGLLALTAVPPRVRLPRVPDDE
ncbi:hypothetical protein KBI23_18800 [bacterium]|nr:hypothetical protein [bacterium]MBP9809722.1 hypothetical protein [bacterium]